MQQTNQVNDIIQIAPGAHFRLDRHLANATYGTVWSATWLEAQASVALKTVRYDSIADAEPEMQALWPQSLQREIQFLETIRSPHLVYFLRKGEFGGMPVLVLEEMDCSLQQLIRPNPKAAAKPVSLGQALIWLRQLLEGLHTIHQRGLSHLDLKPNNLLLSKDGPLGRRIKIADFGESKDCANEDSSQMHSACGTPGWQAPEQFFPCAYTEQGFRYQTDHRADFFALGLLFFFMVTGEMMEFSKKMLALHQQEPEVAAWQECMGRTGNCGGIGELVWQTFSDVDRRIFLGSVAERSASDNVGYGTSERGVVRLGCEQNAICAAQLLERLLSNMPEMRLSDAQAVLRVLPKSLAMDS